MENEEYQRMEIDTRSKLAFAVSELAESRDDTDDRLPIDDYIDDGEFEEVEEAENTEE